MNSDEIESDEIESTSSEEDDLFDVFNLRKSSAKPQKTYSRSTRRSDSQESSSENSYSYKSNRTTQDCVYSTESSSSKKRVSLVRKRPQKRYYNKSKLDDEDDDEILNLEVPSIFKDGFKSQKVYTQHQRVNQRIADQEKAEALRLQQREQQRKQLVEELNQDGERKKYDMVRDRAYLESLLSKDEQALDGYGISRHLYSLKALSFDESKLPKYNLSREISRSLQFLIVRDAKIGFENVKSDFKSFILRSLCMKNPRFLHNLEPLVALHGDKPVLTEEEFEDLLVKLGVDANLIKEDTTPLLKVERQNHELKLQLARLTLLFTTYLHCSTEVDFAKIARYFLLIISDYNANKRELLSLNSFIYTVFPLLCVKFDNIEELVAQLLNVILSIETCLPHDTDKGRIKKKDLELQYNTIKLINVTFSLKTTKNVKIESVIHELNLQYLLGSNYRDYVHKFTKQNLVYQIANNVIIEGNVKDLLELNDLPTADNIYLFYYRVKILPYILVNPFNFTLDREKNIKIIRSMKSSVDRILQSCYGLIRDLGSINIDLVSATLKTGVDKYSFNREELVRFLTDTHQDLSLQCDKLESDLKLVNQDFFYG
ncbi:hypothetical protein CANMA_001952 [Candida margitis]|uniref:uncharacterized protein n=1 Tax=Candida margitis TaxID=1775924 RepID=UPI002226EBAB|nr:uncharacterized protein CANMA_001952 [Candida margitis]KAI5968956.1 hypothetical protein CANMA_001952 [Candida margitis]